MTGEKELKGKIALVTGSGRGLGRAYAMRLADAGADVIIHDKDSAAAARFGEVSSAEQVVEEIRRKGVNSAFYPCDITDPEAIRRFFDKLIADFGHLDIVINNAGGDIGAVTPRPDPNDCLDIKIEDIQSVVSRNLLSTMYMCKYAGLHMRERRNGKIINIASIGGHMASAEGVIYAASKRGIEQYTRCLAEQMRPFDVNVNCLAPGYAKSARIFATRTVAEQENLSRLQRFAEPEDMAEMVYFLASRAADRLTGETIVCW